MLSCGKTINEQLKNHSSMMQEDYEESISLTLRTRSSKKPRGMQEKNGNTNGSRQALQVMQQDFVWKNVYGNIMRTISQ